MSTPVNLFVVHSGITALVAEGVVRAMDLEAAEVCVVHARGRWPVMEGVRSLELTETAPNASVRSAGNARRVAARLRRRVTELVAGRDFRLFVPQLDETTYRLIASHPSCRSAHYLEEGLLSFEPQPAGLLSRLRHPGTVRRVVAGLASYGVLGRYGIVSAAADDWFPGWRTATFFHWSQDAFRWAPNRVRVELRVGPRVDGYPEVIVVADPIDQLGIPLDAYCRVLRRVSNLLYSRGHRRVAVKFHPLQGADGRAEMKASLGAAGLQVETVPDGSILERLLYGRKAVGLGSSALMYAEPLGGQAYSMMDVLMDATPVEDAMRLLAARFGNLTGLNELPRA